MNNKFISNELKKNNKGYKFLNKEEIHYYTNKFKDYNITNEEIIFAINEVLVGTNRYRYNYYIVSSITKNVSCIMISEQNEFITKINESINIKDFYFSLIEKENKNNKKYDDILKKVNYLMKDNLLEQFDFYHNYYFDFIKSDNETNSSSIHIIYENNEDIIYNYNLLIEEEVIPTNIIPIGCDMIGNQLCISVNEDDFGYIYFYEHDGFEDEENFFLIAKSLNEWYSLFKKNED